MGACCSSDSIPDAPKEIRREPDYLTTQEFVTKRLGYWGMSRDFGVWDKEYPDNKNDRREKMWFWVNKSDDGNNKGRIDLESFEGRGEKEDPKKGKVLYSASITEKPFFECFQRIPNTSRDRYFGIYGQDSGYDSEDDSYYLNHPTHCAKKSGNGIPQGQGIITKWKLNTKCVMHDGEKGRGADNFQKDPINLEVFSKGTVVTTWEKKTRTVQDTDKDGNVTGSHEESYIEKDETEFVDRVEFRLIFREQLWSQWVVPGDAKQYGNADPTIDTPFFHASLEGGWFSPSICRIKTKEGIDPCLALLFAHVCATEYSVAEIKNDLNVHTPTEPNYDHMTFGLTAGMGIYQSPYAFNSDSKFTYVVPVNI